MSTQSGRPSVRNIANRKPLVGSWLFHGRLEFFPDLPVFVLRQVAFQHPADGRIPVAPAPPKRDANVRDNGPGEIAPVAAPLPRQVRGINSDVLSLAKQFADGKLSE